jgi:selenocysteine lyase/cysteine desulfurase
MDQLNSALEQEFPVNEQCMYLNHAAVAPWPTSASKAVARFAEENVAKGAADYPHWLEIEKQLRSNLARLINAPVDSVALVKNTSEALSFVAYGIDWRPGDTVVISDEEFPSNSIVWESLKNQGVAVRKVSLAGENPEAELLQAISETPRLVSISAVQYATGTRINLAKIGEACKAAGVLFCVDAIQAVGALKFDVEEIQCDFAMADGHKWLLGPEGLGFFYVREERMSDLSLNEYGWHMIKQAGDYSQTSWEVADTAMRFECGSPNLLAAHALHASTSLLLNTGMENVEAAILSKADSLCGLLSDAGAEIITPAHSRGRSGIVTFGTNGRSPKEVWQALMSKGVICMHRGGGIRFSPHFHTPIDRLQQAVSIAAEECLW